MNSTTSAHHPVTTRGIAYSITRALVGMQVDVQSETRLIAFDDDDNATMRAIVTIADAEAGSVDIAYVTRNGVIHGTASLSGLSENVVAGLVSSILRNG